MPFTLSIEIDCREGAPDYRRFRDAVIDKDLRRVELIDVDGKRVGLDVMLSAYDVTPSPSRRDVVTISFRGGFAEVYPR